MAGRYTSMVNTLQKALVKNFNKRIFIAQEQFYSESQKRYITMYVLQEPIWNEDHTHYTKQQILKTASQIDVVKYLGDLHKKLSEERELGLDKSEEM
ncbi:MAG: hypothetical protein J5725_06180 [Bacteroidales bacterium]|nr:hypothetical protein [Bacteroidales bacterium]